MNRLNKAIDKTVTLSEAASKILRLHVSALLALGAAVVLEVAITVASDVGRDGAAPGVREPSSKLKTADALDVDFVGVDVCNETEQISS